MLYLINPGPGRKRKARKGKRRSAKQRAATKKMLAAAKRARASKKSTRTTKRSTSMARKARKGGAKSRKRRRSSAKRRSPGVRLVRRGVAVYQGNPKRRRSRGRRRYSGNPGILGIVKQGATDAALTLAGGAAARTVSGFVPLPDTGIAGVAKQVGVAVAVGIASRKFLGGDRARFITAGAMQVPLKNLITTVMPGAGQFLGDYDGVGAYISGDDGMAGYVQDVGGMGSLYEGVGEYAGGF